MAKTIVVEDGDHQWLVEGIESLLEASRSHIKSLTLPEEEADKKEVEGNIEELEALHTKLRSA